MKTVKAGIVNTKATLDSNPELLSPSEESFIKCYPLHLIMDISETRPTSNCIETVRVPHDLCKISPKANLNHLPSHILETIECEWATSIRRSRLVI